MATNKVLLARAVGAGKAVALETVYFNDPNHPKTCLEVDSTVHTERIVWRFAAGSGGVRAGYPTLTYGRLSRLEMPSPFVQIRK